MDKQISSLKEELRQTRSIAGSGAISQANSTSAAASPFMVKGSTLAKSPGKHFVEDATGATIFLGSHSDPPVALGCRQAGSDPMLNDAMLLDQLVPRTYPFTNLWKQEPGAGEICDTLPDESDIIRYVLRLANERLSLAAHINTGIIAWIFVLIEWSQILASLSNQRTPLLPSAGDLRAIQYLAICVPKQAHSDIAGK